MVMKMRDLLTCPVWSALVVSVFNLSCNTVFILWRTTATPLPWLPIRLNGGSLTTGDNFGCIGTKPPTAFVVRGTVDKIFFTDITTLPEELFTNVDAPEVNFVITFAGDDDDDDADERMMTTVVELAGRLVITDDAGRRACDVLTNFTGCFWLPLVFSTTTFDARFCAFDTLISDTDVDLASAAVDGFLSSESDFPDADMPGEMTTVAVDCFGRITDTVGFFLATTDDLAVLMLPGCAVCCPLLALVGRTAMCLIGCCCWSVGMETRMLCRFRGRPRRDGNATGGTLAADCKPTVGFSANDQQLVIVNA